MKIKCSKSIENILEIFSNRFQEYFQKDLIGIYIHGSLAMGCYNPVSSDIDIIVVVRNKLTAQQKQDIFQIIYDLEGKTTHIAFEVSIVTKQEVDNFRYPTPIELLYHKDYTQKWLDGKIDLKKTKKDYDLAAHFEITRNRGIVLYGKPIKEIFPTIPKKHYLNSISRDAKWNYNNLTKGPNTGKCKVPVYGVLNFCRVLAFTKHGLIMSKSEGGKWGLENLPKNYGSIINEALKEYNKNGTSQQVNSKILKEFAEYSFQEIYS